MRLNREREEGVSLQSGYTRWTSESDCLDCIAQMSQDLHFLESESHLSELCSELLLHGTISNNAVQ